MAIQLTKLRHGDFEELKGKTSTLHILYKEANHKESMRLLDEADLDPYTSQGILPILTNDEQLTNELRGHRGRQFYLEEKVVLWVTSGIDTVTSGSRFILYSDVNNVINPTIPVVVVGKPKVRSEAALKEKLRTE